MSDMEQNSMEMEMEVETEVVADDDMDVVDMDQNDSGMVRTAVKAVIGAGLAVGSILGIRKVVKGRKKYIESTPRGLIRCK